MTAYDLALAGALLFALVVVTNVIRRSDDDFRDEWEKHFRYNSERWQRR